MVPPFIFTRHPPPGRRTGGPRVVQSSIFTRDPSPERPLRTLSGPGVHLHSLSAARKAYLVREWSSRSSSFSIRYPPPGRRIRTTSGPSSLAMRPREGVFGQRMVQPFIPTRYPPPGKRIRNQRGLGVYLHSLSDAGKAYPDPEWSSRPSSLAIRRREAVFGPRMVQPFIPNRYPPPGRRIRNPRGLGVHLRSPSTAGKAYSDPEWSRRSSSLAIHRREGVLPVRELSSRLSSLAIRRRKGLFGP